MNGLTHQLSYISGAEGSDWANLDESAQMIRNRAGPLGNSAECASDRGSLVDG